jgi:hypothetical protein
MKRLREFYVDLPYVAIPGIVVIEVASLLASTAKGCQQISKTGTKPRRSELKIDWVAQHEC